MESKIASVLLIKPYRLVSPTQAHDRFEQFGVVLKTGYTSTAHAIELITRNCLSFTQEPLAGKTEEICSV